METRAEREVRDSEPAERMRRHPTTATRRRFGLARSAGRSMLSKAAPAIAASVHQPSACTSREKPHTSRPQLTQPHTKDGWQSGRLRTPGKRVYRKVTGVRIPPHPLSVSGAGVPQNVPSAENGTLKIFFGGSPSWRKNRPPQPAICPHGSRLSARGDGVGGAREWGACRRASGGCAPSLSKR